MDKYSESWKKYPLLVIGESSAAFSGAQHLPPQALKKINKQHIFNLYILLNLPPNDLVEAISRIESLGVSSDQILVSVPTELSFSHPSLPFLGVLDRIEGESVEELRSRLFIKLEIQKQKKLPFVLREFQQSELSRNLDETQLQQVIDTARLAHALCFSYELPPLIHGAALRACLQNPETKMDSPWSSNIPLEQMIAQAAALVLDCFLKKMGIREVLRDRAAALPFRTRTELLHHVETSLGISIGGKSRAA